MSPNTSLQRPDRVPRNGHGDVDDQMSVRMWTCLEYVRRIRTLEEWLGLEYHIEMIARGDVRLEEKDRDAIIWWWLMLELERNALLRMVGRKRFNPLMVNGRGHSNSDTRLRHPCNQM